MARLRRRFWIHFGVLTLLAVIVEALAPLRFQPASAEMIGWGVNGLYRLVPVVSAIAVGFLPWSSSRVLRATRSRLLDLGVPFEEIQHLPELDTMSDLEAALVDGRVDAQLRRRLKEVLRDGALG